ncbi:hypothetical protein RF11_16071 [Thelohanellus kitauei]|uniref:Uncharacterized protein n=1 Tax=Thelohanellus kitauei TaxID=669202 RepID=A0A0C2MVL7_THEKT|nr:hypothetical protein RF11_16071 [Thelohanellus kitauei]
MLSLKVVAFFGFYSALYFLPVHSSFWKSLGTNLALSTLNTATQTINQAAGVPTGPPGAPPGAYPGAPPEHTREHTLEQGLAVTRAAAAVEKTGVGKMMVICLI